jgi:hypothetical protein
MTQFLTSQYWIAPNAITFGLNAMGDPQKVSVSISSGAVVMAYMPGVEGLGYDNGHNFRRWRLRGYASLLQAATVTQEIAGEPSDTTYPATYPKYVYILIPRSAQVGDEATVGFAPCEIDYLGFDANGIQVGSDNYYYLFTRGVISASVEGGNRSWSHQIETGTLATEEAYQEGSNMPWFVWDSVTDTVKFMKKIFMDVASWFDNLRTSAISFVGTGSQDKGTVTSVADFGSMSDNSTQAIVTPKYLLDREASVEQKYLRKDQDDSTDYKLTAEDLEALNTLKGKIAEIEQSLTLGELNSWAKGTIQHAKFRDDFNSGDSWGIYPEGRMQLNTLEVRSSLKVLELIYNRLTATESDYVFTEGGTVEEIVSHDGDQYVLRLKKRNDTDFHAFRKGDVLRGVVNDLAHLGSGQYYTSWMRVTDIDTQEDNTITVVVYPGMSDDETPVPVVPGGVNYPPNVHMVLQRWGNAVEPTAQAHANPDYASFIVLNNDGVTYRNTRQACWYLSSIEKRIAMLDGVDAPILRESNYTAFFGLPYNLSTFKGHTMDPTQPYLYVRGAFLQDIHYIDYQGNIIRQERNRGVWTQEDATNDPYVRNDSTYDTCYYNNRKWQVVVSQARALPPSTDNADWLMLYEGITPQYRIIPSVLNVLRNPDGTTSLVDNLITCDVVVDEGGEEPRFAPESEVEVYIGVNGDTPTHVSPYRSHVVASTDHSIEFYLWNKMSEFGEESELGDAIFAYLTGMVSVPIYERGSNGDTPTIDPETGNWIIGGVVTEYPSQGDEGHSPKIGEDGYWYEWDATTGAYHKTTYYAEGNQVLAQYSEDCIDWYDVYFSGALWMRTKKTGDANWGDPFRCVGEKGEGGNYVESDFAISARLTMPLDDVSSWQDAPPATTSAKPYLWMRQMLKEWDAEHNTYSNGWDSFKFTRVTGEKGETGATGATGPQGPQGVGGSYTLTEYGISASRTSPTDVGNNWDDVPPVTDYSHPYLWARMMLKEWNASTSQYVDAWQVYHYVLMTGPDGLPGRTSKPLRGPSEWNSLSNYLSGTGNELVQDIVYHKDHPYNMYLCMVSNSGVEPNENTTANSNWTAEKPWASAEYREFTASKVLFAARGKIENADIDNVTIRGTITEDCQSLTDRVLIMGSAVSGQETRLRSVLSALTLDDPDDPTVIPEWTRCSRTNNQIIQLPTYLETLIGGIDYKSNPYQIAGTKISIYTTPDVNLLNWWCNDFYDDNHFGDTNYAAVMNEGVLVCADPDSLLGEIEDVGGLVRVRPRHLWNGMQLKEGEGTHGRFSFRGRVARFVLLLPGQHLDLESQIQYMPKQVTEPYSELTYEPTLVWNIVNAADFDAIDINMNINVPVVGVSAAADGAYFSRVSSVSGAGMTGGNEVFVCNKLIYEKAGVEQSLQLNLNVTLAGHFENGGSESDVDLPSWAFAITHPTPSNP